MPALPIERGRPGPGLVSHVVVSKYADHLPLHRQAVIYGRHGVELDRATLADWVGMRRSCWRRSPKQSGAMSAPGRRCTLTTRRCRCWLQA
jgi:transposase